MKATALVGILLAGQKPEFPYPGHNVIVGLPNFYDGVKMVWEVHICPIYSTILGISPFVASFFRLTVVDV